MIETMKLPAKIIAKRLAIKPLLAALTLIAPIIGSASSARADDDMLKHDGRMEGYQRPVYIEVGTAADYLLLGGMLVLGAMVMLKDAKRTHKKT
jgi:hypothetical protein